MVAVPMGVGLKAAGVVLKLVVRLDDVNLVLSYYMR